MDTVRKLLDAKGPALWSIVPDASVYDAIDMMANKGCGALVVMTGADLVGIISERDYARKIVLQGKRSRDTKVREIMTTEVVCITGERTVEDAMALMTGKRVRHLPVVAGDKVEGVVSIGDVVKAVIDEKEFHIQQLEMYITRSG